MDLILKCLASLVIFGGTSCLASACSSADSSGGAFGGVGGASSGPSGAAGGGALDSGVGGPVMPVVACGADKDGGADSGIDAGADDAGSDGGGDAGADGRGPTSCDAPRTSDCLDEVTRVDWNSRGTCVRGQCEFTPTFVECGGGCFRTLEGNIRCNP